MFEQHTLWQSRGRRFSGDPINHEPTHNPILDIDYKNHAAVFSIVLILKTYFLLTLMH